MIVAELKIIVNEDQSMQVTGPLHDEEWCLKCLEMAKDTIKNRNKKKESIILPHDYVDKKILSIIK